MTATAEVAKANPEAGFSSTQSGVDQNFADQYVSFWIGNQLLGVSVQTVQEVLTAQEIARTPRAKPEIAGLLNLRGQIVTAVDLRKRMKLPPITDDKQPLNVVVRNAGESFSFLVDDVGDVITISADRMEAVPPTLDARWKSVTTGVFRLEKQLFVILNVAAILQF